MLFTSSRKSNLPALLSCQAFGMAFGSREIFSALDFDLEPGGVSILTGPAGSGKSTLLHTLAGLSQQNSRFRCWGEVSYLGQPLGTRPHPWLVRQDAKLMQAPVIDALTDALRANPNRSSSLLSRERIKEELCALGVPELVAQLSHRSVELPTVLQRAMPIVLAAMRGEALLLLDEPAIRLPEEEADYILSLIAAVARSSTVLVVMHDEQHAARIGTHRVTMADHCIPAREPDADIAAESAGTTSAWNLGGIAPLPAADSGIPALHEIPANEPDARKASGPALKQTETPGSGPVGMADGDIFSAAAIDERPTVKKMARGSAGSGGLALVTQVLQNAAPDPRGPAGFCWVIPARLAGTAMPSGDPEFDQALGALARAGVTRLITLTEKDIPLRVLARHGLANLHLPVRDLEPPTAAQTHMLLIRMQGMLDRGEVLAVHCGDGMGRTGTVLAAWLIREGGLSAPEALSRLRRIDTGFVRNTEQEDFLHEYENSFLKT